MDYHEGVCVALQIPSDVKLTRCSPEVEFCGYTAPHPSEPKIHLRIQMYGE